ncbi:hypothetical protein CRG98_008978 [Punica granatum]|uniref:Uncharacterized protein n=1 Tax=Punica granatum TaxID=22663 RepID=A0A2I0KQH6_PUNGR|nr:hypothetical protein CRG98_008978 [Punica granatum]
MGHIEPQWYQFLRSSILEITYSALLERPLVELEAEGGGARERVIGVETAVERTWRRGGSGRSVWQRTWREGSQT